MVESKEYSPTPAEWDELVLLWHRSGAIYASALTNGVKTRLAWTAKTFVDTHPDVTRRAVYAWLERNLEIARGPSPMGERPQVEHDTPRSTPHGHDTKLGRDVVPLVPDSDLVKTPPFVAVGPRVD